jgi:hydroxymethylglutaryl-CoA reductase (NADPH)
MGHAGIVQTISNANGHPCPPVCRRCPGDLRNPAASIAGRGIVAQGDAMSASTGKAAAFIQRHLGTPDTATLRRRLEAKPGPSDKKLPGGTAVTGERVEERRRAVGASEALDPAGVEVFARNIENFIGTLTLPVGVAGPLRVNGLFAQGDYFVPLATTEAALVASFDRGARILTEAGGCAALVVNEGVTRAPGFAFRSMADAGEFVVWASGKFEEFRATAEATTRFGRLIDVRFNGEANHVYLQLEFSTGAAAGQNMVTIATQAVCDYIIAHTPVQPEYHFVEANFSGDKKASAMSFSSVRGRKVCAEAVLSAELVRRRLHTTPARMADYWRMSALGGVMSGTIGVQGHYANGLAALYLATGQDAACVAESAVGVTRFEIREDGALYAAVTLPNIIVGTVGGGTGLPGQRACLEILRLARPEDANALAEICAALALAGEISIIGALSAHEFTRAHARRARGRTPAPTAE